MTKVMKLPDYTPQLMRLHIHRWSPWSKLVKTYDGVYQYKYCTLCNKIAKRKLGVGIEFDLQDWNHGEGSSNET